MISIPPCFTPRIARIRSAIDCSRSEKPRITITSEAQVVAQVHVQRGAHAVAQLVLQVGQLPAEIADMMVVDQRERTDRLDALRHLGATDRRARQIAQQLRARAAALRSQPVELTEQRSFDRDTETDERVLHPASVVSESRIGGVRSDSSPLLLCFSARGSSVNRIQNRMAMASSVTNANS